LRTPYGDLAILTVDPPVPAFYAEVEVEWSPIGDDDLASDVLGRLAAWYFVVNARAFDGRFERGLLSLDVPLSAQPQRVGLAFRNRLSDSTEYEAALRVLALALDGFFDGRVSTAELRPSEEKPDRSPTTYFPKISHRFLQTHSARTAMVGLCAR